MSERVRVHYLHGFASGPQSRKALFFAEQLQQCGIELQIPDLAEGDFAHLTVSRQLRLLERQIGNEPAVLIGSSLGGYLAALYAARYSSIQRLLLLAPAFGFSQLWEARVGAETLDRWQENGSLDVFHYGEGREVPLGYEFFADACRYEPFPDCRQPVLLVHGRSDAVVPLEQSLQFVRLHPACRLVPVASGHELTDVLPYIWESARPFLLDGHLDLPGGG